MFLRCGLQCYAQVFACSYSYVFTLTIPNSILTYWAFPAEVAAYGNAFAVSRAHIHSSCRIHVGVGSSVDVYTQISEVSQKVVMFPHETGVPRQRAAQHRHHSDDRAPDGCLPTLHHAGALNSPNVRTSCCGGSALPTRAETSSRTISQVFYMGEKALRIHNKSYWIRLPLRLPLSGAVWLVAVAFPFYVRVSLFVLSLLTSSAPAPGVA